MHATLIAYDVTIAAVLSELRYNITAPVTPLSVTHLPTPVSWPSSAKPGATILFSLRLVVDPDLAPAHATTDYWLANLDDTTPQDFRALGALRDHITAYVKLQATVCLEDDAAAPRIVLTLTAPAGTAAVAFACRASLRWVTPPRGSDDSRILPVVQSRNYVALVPGDSVVITFHTAALAQGLRQAMQVELDGWNVVSLSLPVNRVCMPAQRSQW